MILNLDLSTSCWPGVTWTRSNRDTIILRYLRHKCTGTHPMDLKYTIYKRYCTFYKVIRQVLVTGTSRNKLVFNVLFILLAEQTAVYDIILTY